MVIEIDGTMDSAINEQIRCFPNVYDSIVLPAI